VISLGKIAFALTVSLVLAGPGWTENRCDQYDLPVKTGQIVDKRIHEISGLAASARNPGILWLHNDSGDQPRLFAIKTSGELAAVYSLEPAIAIDWEDLAIGPGPRSGVDYLYIGDIGDNGGRRSHITVYRVEEPLLTAAQAEVQTLTNVTPIHLRYPDGAHNAEILLSDPRTGDLIIVTKDFVYGNSGIYRFRYPHTPRHHSGSPDTLEAVGGMQFRGWRPADIAATAGDVSPAGDRIILRTYTQTLVWTRMLQTQIGHELMKTPCPTRNVGIGLPFDQYEAIAYANGGKSFYTISEGRDQMIYRFDLASEKGKGMNR
jgi:hypothetical protein